MVSDDTRSPIPIKPLASAAQQQSGADSPYLDHSVASAVSAPTLRPVIVPTLSAAAIAAQHVPPPMPTPKTRIVCSDCGSSFYSDTTFKAHQSKCFDRLQKVRVADWPCFCWLLVVIGSSAHLGVCWDSPLDDDGDRDAETSCRLVSRPAYLSLSLSLSFLSLLSLSLARSSLSLSLSLSLLSLSPCS
jgi:hypothetical protein